MNNLPTSHRIEETPSAIIDVLLDEYADKVKYNLAPGATFFGLCAQAKEMAKSDFDNRDEKTDLLSKYGDVIGDESLRTLWCNVLAYGSNYPSNLGDLSLLKKPEQVFPSHEFMITAGANQGFVNVITALCDPGDEVILILPYYFSQYNALVMSGVEPVCIPVNPKNLVPDANDITKHITNRSRVVVIVNPGNPSGVIYSESLLREITDICERNSIWLVVDEAYREFNYMDIGRMTPTIPLQKHIIKLFTMSKAYGLAGWRIGAVLYPRYIAKAMRKAQDTIPTHAARFSQVVAYHALRFNPFGQTNEGGRILELERVREAFVSQLEHVYKSHLSSIDFVIPYGAFYVFAPYAPRDEVESLTEVDDMNVVKTLAQEFGVLVCPGFAFGMSGYIRISYGTITPEHAIAAAAVISNGLKSILQSFNNVSGGSM